MTRTLLAAGTAVAVLAAASAAQAQTSTFSQMVVFGDSLSDTGNVATLGNRAELNSFTTNPGLVAIEVVGAHYGLTLAPSLKGGTNYAYGSAGFVNNSFGASASIVTLTNQINGYLAAHPVLDPKGLYTVFGGGNDVNFNATSLVIGTVTLAQATASVSAGAVQELASIDALQKAGARTIIVFNVPNVGQTPTAKSADAITPGSSARIAGLSQAYNAVLTSGLASRTGIVPVNAYALLDETIADPAAFGLSNVTGTACTTSSLLDCTTATLKAPDADKTWLFADGIHPTTAGHAALGRVVLSELAAPQQISLLAETPFAFSSVSRSVSDGALTGDKAHTFAEIAYANGHFEAQGDLDTSDTDGAILTVGGVFPLNEHTLVGLSGTVGKTQTDFGGGGGFDTSAQLLSVFIRRQLGERLFITTNSYFGRLSFDDVERQIFLGGSTRTQTGGTDGNARGAGVSAGYWFGGEGGLRHGPLAGLAYQTVRVDPYAEKGTLSTAMTFGQQERKSLVSTVGWAMEGTWKTQAATINPFGQVTYNMESETDPRIVEAGLVTMGGTFSMAGFQPGEDWIGMRLGAGFAISDHLSVTAAYNGRLSDNAQDQHLLNLGLHMAY